MRELRQTKTLLITLSTPERGVVSFIAVAEASKTAEINPLKLIL